jgi:hypothetical protein
MCPLSEFSNMLLDTKVANFGSNGTNFIRLKFTQPSSTPGTQLTNFIEIDDSDEIIGIKDLNCGTSFQKLNLKIFVKLMMD